MLDNLDLAGILETVIQGVITFGVALLTLLLFYLIARVVSGLIRRVLRKTDIDNRLAEAISGDDLNFSFENMIATAVFWIIMIFGLIAFFERLELAVVTGPLNTLLDRILGYVPTLGGALLLFALAWVIATIVKTVILRLTEMTNLDERLNSWDSDGDQQTAIGPSLANAGYWLVFLLFLPGILDKLGMQDLVAPLNDMLSEFLSFLPNLIGAAVILFVGMLIARIVRQIVTSLLGAVGLDKFGQRAGLNMSLTSVIGTLIYTVIMLLVIVQALTALEIESVSAPATNMINLLFASVPNIIGAGLVLGISYIVGKLVAGLVAGLLAGMGFDGVPAKLGLNMDSERSPSDFVGWLVLAGFMLLAALAATDLLQFEPLSEIVQTFIGFASQIVIGLIVLAIGLYLANVAADLARNAGMSGFTVSLIRAAIMVLVGAMALERIGIGANIVELAFGIGLGAIGIAAALAFGLGSRDLAGREVERFVTSVRSEEQ